ncbi:MAG: lactonase family protein [Turicibacter sp.]|nr:lactonase family protein [Turicibacter sp.]
MDKEAFLIGGYTKGLSQGIYEITLNKEENRLEDLKIWANESFPTYLAKNGELLYALSGMDGKGGIAVYEGNRFLKRDLSEGPGLCHVSLDPCRGLVYGSNYHLGEIRVYRSNPSDPLFLVTTIKHEGSGPHPNQPSARVHYAGLAPDKRLVACDLGADGVYVYDVSSDGTLDLATRFQAAPGAGPRHLLFHPGGKFAYLLGELASTIHVLEYFAKTGEFQEVACHPMLPDGFSDWNAGAALRLSPDAKFLYASNRGHDSIVCFEVLKSGAVLNPLEWTPTYGKIPRDFNLSNCGNFLIVVHQESGNATLFGRNPVTGELTLLQKDVLTPEATCIIPKYN